MRHLSWVRLGVLGLAVVTATATQAQGQESTLFSDRAPRFLSAATPVPVPLDVGRMPVLRRRISLDLNDVTLKEALDEISRQASLPIMYSKQIVPLDTRVRLRAQEITVAGALAEVLMDAGVDVLLSSDRRAALVKRPRDASARIQQGTIAGAVTEAETGNPVVNAQIAIDGQGRTFTDNNGRYRIDTVVAGLRTVTVTSIGYAPSSREVEVADGEAVTVDFTLEVSPSALSELVVTATGEQRRVEMGHVVGRINADSVVRHAPVTSVSDLLTGRVPGALVQPYDGQVGVASRIRIRGPNSYNGGTAAPVVIVDGVRFGGFRQAAGLGNPDSEQGSFRVAAPSRLDNLGINDIESIEVVKGPSAATLYGPDAANGVIVITTKRGQAGPARWRTYAKAALTDVPISSFPEENWWGWSTDGTGQQNWFSCSLNHVAVGTCAQDSITRIPNPLNDEQWTLYSSKPRWNYGANVSGGEEGMRYFFSADVEEATGALQIPAGEQTLLKERLGLDELPEEWINPNRFLRVNLRGNIAKSLGETAELDFTVGFVRNTNRTARVIGSPWQDGYLRQPPPANSPTPYTISTDRYGTSPAEFFATTSTEHLNRWTATATAQWRPTSFLSGRVVAGLDLANSRRLEIAPRGVPLPSCFSCTNGEVVDARTQTGIYTFTADATATARRGRLSSRTSVGAQYYRSLTEGLSGRKQDLLPVGESLSQAQTTVSPSPSQSHVELASLGTYAEQMFGLNERLFVTGALRADQASSFGQNAPVSVHPKASVSWLVSEEPRFPELPALDELRLRAAFGSSLIQPPLNAAPAQFAITSAFVEGSDRSRADPSLFSNPDVRPERVRELEFGLDATALDQRLRLELSWYRRRTADALQEMRGLPPSLWGIGQGRWENIGLITNNGFEALLDARLVDRGIVSLDVTVAHSYYDNRIAEIGDVAIGSLSIGVEGYPLGAVFVRPVMDFADADGDGSSLPPSS